MALQWREQFSVANDLIDSDHKQLIEIINQAQRCLECNQASELTLVLDQLMRYGQMHFKREEVLAKAVAYPQAEQLQVSHAQLCRNLQAFKDEVGTQWSAAAVAKFTAFLRDWLIGHVIKEDMLLKPFLQKHSPRFDPR